MLSQYAMNLAVRRLVSLVSIAVCVGCSAPSDPTSYSLLPAAIPNGLTEADVVALFRASLESSSKILLHLEQTSDAALNDAVEHFASSRCTPEERRLAPFVCNAYDSYSSTILDDVRALHVRAHALAKTDADALKSALSNPRQIARALQLLPREAEDGDFVDNVARTSPHAESPLLYRLSAYEAAVAAWSKGQITAHALREMVYARNVGAQEPVERTDAFRYGIVLARLALRLP